MSNTAQTAADIFKFKKENLNSPEIDNLLVPSGYLPISLVFDHHRIEKIAAVFEEIKNRKWNYEAGNDAADKEKDPPPQSIPDLSDHKNTENASRHPQNATGKPDSTGGESAPKKWSVGKRQVGETEAEYLKRHNFRFHPPVGDKIAWYRPAHYSELDSSEIPKHAYGIYFDALKVLEYAETLVDEGSTDETKMNVAKCVAIIGCYYHEMCHAWVEDIVTLAECSSGQDRKEGFYQSAMTANGSYIYLEEALCNSVAFGEASRFFTLNSEAIGKFQDEILTKLEQSMRGSGPGYMHFRRDDSFEHTNIWFIREMARHLHESYLIDIDSAKTLVRNYFLDPLRFKNFLDYPVFTVHSEKMRLEDKLKKVIDTLSPKETPDAPIGDWF